MLWAFGSQRNATDPHDRETKDYLTLKKYSPDGEQLKAYLWRSMFPAGMEPGEYQWQERRITVTPDTVGIEAPSGMDSGKREWVELDLNGNIMGRWRLDSRNQFPGVV